MSESTSFAETSTTIESQESGQYRSSQSTATQDNKFEFSSTHASSTSEIIQKQTEDATSFVETSTTKVAKLSHESCKLESQEGNQSTTSMSIETQDDKVEFASKEASSTSEVIQMKTVDEHSKKDDIWKQQETESTISSIESTKTVTTMAQNTNQSSVQKLSTVETKSLLEGDVTMESAEEPEALPKPDRETEDDLERKNEKKSENQAAGIQETQRLLLGEQMEEKYPAPEGEETREPGHRNTGDPTFV